MKLGAKAQLSGGATGFTTTITRGMPSLTATPATQGASYQVVAHAAPKAVFATFVGIGRPPISVAPFGDLGSTLQSSCT